jgi:anti-sigma regulatory factor (Ser/Thr protein kinase)
MTGSTDEHTTIVLAVAKQDRFSRLMAHKLDAPDREVHVTADLAEFRTTVEEKNPDLVVLNGTVEYAPELRQWLKGRPRDRLTSLIGIYPEALHPATQEGFRVLEDEVVVEPYEVAELNAAIRNELERLNNERKYFRHEVKFRLPSQPTYVQQGGDFIETLTKNTGLEEEAWLSLVNACREALDNGARHGNQSRPDRYLHVTYVLDWDKLTVTVEDEGTGFDTGEHLGNGVEGDAVALARKRHAQGKVGGLGIMLMVRCVDKLEYNRKGNALKLTKRLKPREEAVAS